MARLQPMFAGEKSAAQLLDMKPVEFLALVKEGILPKPVRIGHFDRWDATELQAIMRGESPDGYEDVKW